MSTDFREIALAIVDSSEASVPIDVARGLVHFALRQEAGAIDAQAEKGELVDYIDQLRGTIAIACGQIEIGNVRGAHEMLKTLAQTRGRNARIEGT